MIPFVYDSKKPKLIYRDRNQIIRHCMGRREGRQVTKQHRGNFGVPWICHLGHGHASQGRTCDKTDQTEHLKCVQFIVCQLYLNKCVS